MCESFFCKSCVYMYMEDIKSRLVKEMFVVMVGSYANPDLDNLTLLSSATQRSTVILLPSAPVFHWELHCTKVKNKEMRARQPHTETLLLLLQHGHSTSIRYCSKVPALICMSFFWLCKGHRQRYANKQMMLERTMKVWKLFFLYGRLLTVLWSANRPPYDEMQM